MELDWRSIVIFLNKQGKNATEINQEIISCFPEIAPSYSAITRILRSQKIQSQSSPRMILQKNQCQRENINKILKALKDFPFASVRQIEKVTGIPKSTIFDILTKSLGYTSRHLKWIPHFLNQEQKKNRIELSKRLLKTVQRARRYSYELFLTGDESWFYLETDYELVWLRVVKNLLSKKKK